jgi:hypothetical protein
LNLQNAVRFGKFSIVVSNPKSGKVLNPKSGNNTASALAVAAVVKGQQDAVAAQQTFESSPDEELLGFVNETFTVHTGVGELGRGAGRGDTLTIRRFSIDHDTNQRIYSKNGVYLPYFASKSKLVAGFTEALGVAVRCPGTKFDSSRRPVYADKQGRNYNIAWEKSFRCQFGFLILQIRAYESPRVGRRFFLICERPKDSRITVSEWFDKRNTVRCYKLTHLPDVHNGMFNSEDRVMWLVLPNGKLDQQLAELLVALESVIKKKQSTVSG